MNELQIRLTADIQGLQSAINKAKQTLKSFESETATDSEKSNVGFRRKIGLIEQLTAKAKQLKVSLTQATNEQDIASFNAQLEQTNIELTRLNALGKTFSAPAVRSFNNLKRSAGAATGSAIAFNRIIQDAPFGIIGVGNNIQQFSEQFAALGGKATTAGQKLSAFFTALITPANLAILAVSALTAAWQAYSLGLFDSEEETRDLNKELEDFKENLDGISKAQLEGVQSAQKEIQAFQLLRLQAENANIPLQKRLLAVKKLKEENPDLLKGYTDEEILLGKVSKAYEELTKQITAKALATAFSSQTAENAVKAATLEFREQKKSLDILKETAELKKQIANRDRAEQGGQFVAGQNVIISYEILKTQKKINQLNEENKESEETRKELTEENLFLNKKVAEEIAKAGGLIDNNNDNLDKGGEKLNRVFDDQILILERFGAASEDAKKKLEGLASINLDLLAKEQKSLFEQITRLNQQPISFANAAQLAIASKRLSEIDKIIGSIASKRTDTEITVDESKLERLELPVKQDLGIVDKLEKEIAFYESLKKVTTDPDQLEKYKLKLSELRNELALVNADQVSKNTEIIVDAFSSLGAGIAASLNIGDRALRGFVTTLLSQTPKIIAALSKQADANLNNSSKNIAADKAESISSGIKQGTKFAEALGPVGLALLPVLIAGAVAVISSAFGKVSGGGSVSPGTGSTFTNRREFGGPVSKGRAYIVGERRPELFVPNTNGIIVPQLPSMDYSGASMSVGAMAVDVNIRGVSYGDDILFTVQQAQIRRGLR